MSTLADRPNALVLRDDLEQLHAAGGDTGEEELGRRDRLAGTSVVDGAVGDEVLIPAAPENASEDIRRTGGDLVASRRHGGHAQPASRPASVVCCGLVVPVASSLRSSPTVPYRSATTSHESSRS